MTYPYGTTVWVLGGGKWAAMGAWKVVKVNPTTYRLQCLGNEQQFLRAPHMLVTDQEPEGPKYDGYSTSMPKRTEGLRAGAVITLKMSVDPKYGPETLWVIIRDKYQDLHIVPLGGNAEKPNNYFIIPWQHAEVIDLAAMASRSQS